MMAVVVGGFTVCWFPFAIMFILFPTNQTAREYFIDNIAVIDWITWIGKSLRNLDLMLIFSVQAM